MINIIIGCPYTSMSNITKALQDIGNKNVFLVNSNDIKALDLDNIFVGDNLQKYSIDTFSSSFLRYPYDLISPHSETYVLREEIEFYKSIALAFDMKSINSLASTWMLRNRHFSLKQALIEGVKISDATLMVDVKCLALLNNEEYAIKAIGNCFVTEKLESLDETVASIVKTEKEPDGDEAAIFPASLLNRSEIKKYINIVGSIFIQMPFLSPDEYRCYIIGNKNYIYKRQHINNFDKSTASYLTTNYSLSEKTLIGMQKLMKKFNLNYICFDLICDKDEGEITIDINPYGALPKYEDYPEPSIALAELLIEM